MLDRHPEFGGAFGLAKDKFASDICRYGSDFSGRAIGIDLFDLYLSRRDACAIFVKNASADDDLRSLIGLQNEPVAEIDGLIGFDLDAVFYPGAIPFGVKDYVVGA